MHVNFLTTWNRFWCCYKVTQFLFSCNKSKYSLFWRKRRAVGQKMKENNGMDIFIQPKRKTLGRLRYVLHFLPSIVATRLKLQGIVWLCFHVTRTFLRDKYKLFSKLWSLKLSKSVLKHNWFLQLKVKSNNQYNDTAPFQVS